MKYIPHGNDSHVKHNPQYLISHGGWDMFWYKMPNNVCVIRTVKGDLCAREEFSNDSIKKRKMDYYQYDFFKAKAESQIGKAYLLAFEKVCDLLQDPSISPNSR